MISASASRVMSSWVGPRPPQTTTASLRSRARPMAATIRSRLSPTLVWKEPSRCPASAEVLADPGRVGVDDLAEEELGADGNHLAPKAHRPHSPAHTTARWLSSKYCALASPGSARPPPTASCLGDVRGGEPHRAGGRKPTARSCDDGLHLGPTTGGQDGHPPARPPTPGTRSGPPLRQAMRATGTHQNTPVLTSTAMAASTTILSARGSRKAPDRVAPWRRASQPSRPSVQFAMRNHTEADGRPRGAPGGEDHGHQHRHDQHASDG